MKIGLLYDSLGRSKGGVEAWMYHAADGLAKMGHSPVVFGMDAGVRPVDAMPPEVTLQWVPVEQFHPVSKLLNPLTHKSFKHLASQIGSYTTDLDAFWARSFSMILAASYLAGNRPLLYVQATPFPVYLRLTENNGSSSIKKRFKTKTRNTVMTLLEKQAMDRADSIVYLSMSRMNETLEYYGERFREKCHVVPAGVDMNRFSVQRTRERLDGCLRVVSVCRLSIEKNLRCLLSAVSIAKSRGLDIEATIVGEGPMRAELEALRSELGIADRIELAGEQAMVENFLNNADLFVLPSTYEGFGSAYIEAMACGLPCVALHSNPPFIQVASEEVIEDGENGWLLKDDSAEEMADLFCFLSRNPDTLKAAGDRARQVCESRYTWEKNLESLLMLSGKKKTTLCT